MSCVLWWFFALSRNRTRHAHDDLGRSRTVHVSACHGASAWGCETTHRTSLMPFLALDLSLDLIRGLRPTIELLRRKSPRLDRKSTRLNSSH